MLLLGDYLCQARHQGQIDLPSSGKVLMFLQKHFPHWLEALSLMGNISDGAAMVRNLESVLMVSDALPPYPQ